MTKVISQYDGNILNIVVLMNTFVENSLINHSDCTADQEFERLFHLMFPYLRVSLRRVTAGRKLPMIANPSLLISEHSTVKELCDKMMDRFGREVIVQRYTINTWLPVKHSRHWTLKNQNEEARKLACLNPDM